MPPNSSCFVFSLIDRQAIRLLVVRHSFVRRLTCAARLAALGLILFSTLPVEAWEPAELKPYPQKVRTFYGLNDAAVPAELRSNSVPLPVTSLTSAIQATDGAIWLGTTQVLLRHDFTAPERDQRQYLAGRRYLRTISSSNSFLMSRAGFGCGRAPEWPMSNSSP